MKTRAAVVFEPGAAFQFDWSEDWAIIAGMQIKLQAGYCQKDCTGWR